MFYIILRISYQHKLSLKINLLQKHIFTNFILLSEKYCQYLKHFIWINKIGRKVNSVQWKDEVFF